MFLHDFYMCIRPLCCSWAHFGRVPLFFFVVARLLILFFFSFDFLIFRFFRGYHTIFVWSFSSLRFISAQRMREEGHGRRRRSALQDSFFSAAGRKKEKKEKLSSQQHLGAAFFLLPLRCWRPTCRSERVSDRTIKLKEDNPPKKRKEKWARHIFMCVRISFVLSAAPFLCVGCVDPPRHTLSPSYPIFFSRRPSIYNITNGTSTTIFSFFLFFPGVAFYLI